MNFTVLSAILLLHTSNAESRKTKCGKFLMKNSTCMLHTCTRSGPASSLHLTGNLWVQGSHLQCKKAASSRPQISASVSTPSIWAEKKMTGFTQDSVAQCFITLFPKQNTDKKRKQSSHTHLAVFGGDCLTGISVLETLNAGLKFLCD